VFLVVVAAVVISEMTRVVVVAKWHHLLHHFGSFVRLLLGLDVLVGGVWIPVAVAVDSIRIVSGVSVGSIQAVSISVSVESVGIRVGISLTFDLLRWFRGFLSGGGRESCEGVSGVAYPYTYGSYGYGYPTYPFTAFAPAAAEKAAEPAEKVKREADADADADAFYGYGYGHGLYGSYGYSGYNPYGVYSYGHRYPYTTYKYVKAEEKSDETAEVVKKVVPFGHYYYPRHFGYNYGRYYY
jgi:hypothetical protein